MTKTLPGRRAALGTMALGTCGLAAWRASRGQEKTGSMAKVAVTLDLEMSRNFPRWEDTHWDYDKGNLDQPAKDYTVRVCDAVQKAGAKAHLFAVGRLFEQGDVEWLRLLSGRGHLVGNHTYDHVNVTARRLEDVQYRFNRSPWLVDGKSADQVIRENIRLAGVAIETRLGTRAAGFRTPGGFADGLADRPDVRAWLKESGHTWVSAKYPAHPAAKAGLEPDRAFLRLLVEAQEKAQPFRYPDGLIEVPMSPISDIGAFRTGRWKLEWFLRAIGTCLEAVIEKGGCFDFLAHPSCLGVVDPRLETVHLITETVARNSHRAKLCTLDELAATVV